MFVLMFIPNMYSPAFKKEKSGETENRGKKKETREFM